MTQRRRASLLSAVIAVSIVLILLFIFLTGANISLGTIRTPMAATYLYWVILAGKLFQLPGILLSTVAGSLAVLGLIVAENSGLLPQPNYSVGLTQWMNFTALFGVTACMVYYGNRMTQNALTRAEDEIEQRKLAEAELRKLTLAMEQSPAAVLMADRAGNIEYVNPQFEDMSGYLKAELMGLNPCLLTSGQTPTETYRQIWSAISDGGKWRGELEALVGDVMGKGVQAALMGAAIITAYNRALAELLLARQNTQSLPSPAEIVNAIHQSLTPQLMAISFFATLALYRFDLDAGTLSYVNAGHTPGLLARAGGARPVPILGENLPIGVMSEENYIELSLAIGPGDSLLVFSDGITEARSPQGVEFGLARLSDLIEAGVRADLRSTTIMQALARRAGPARRRSRRPLCVQSALEPGGLGRLARSHHGQCREPARGRCRCAHPCQLRSSNQHLPSRTRAGRDCKHHLPHHARGRGPGSRTDLSE
jgi:PAS domain S-box-containing protein